MNARIRTIEVTRDGDVWVATIGEDSTFAKTMARLRTYVREVIVLQEDLDDDAAPEFIFVLAGTPAAGIVERARSLRAALAASEQAATEATRLAARSLHEANISDRDSAELLGLSFQRVHQLRHAGI